MISAHAIIVKGLASTAFTEVMIACRCANIPINEKRERHDADCEGQEGKDKSYPDAGYYKALALGGFEDLVYEARSRKSPERLRTGTL